MSTPPAILLTTSPTPSPRVFLRVLCHPFGRHITLDAKRTGAQAPQPAAPDCETAAPAPPRYRTDGAQNAVTPKPCAAHVQ